MSFLHTIIFYFIKRGQTSYDPGVQPDYGKARAEEAKGVPQTLPRGVKSRKVTLDEISGEYLFSNGNPADQCVLYIHGGGFVTGSTKTVRPLTGTLVKTLGRNVYSIRYRLAPEHPFPAAPEDCFRAYQTLEGKYGGANIILMGESAGATLALATTLRAKDEGLSLPACVIALAPAVQFDQAFPSYTENLNTDCMVSNLCVQVRDTYLPHEADLCHPYAAPYYGNFAGFPPTLLIASDSEVLRDDSVFLHQKLLTAEVESKLSLYHSMMHIFPVIPSLPESKRAYREMREFVDIHAKGKKGVKPCKPSV